MTGATGAFGSAICSYLSSFDGVGLVAIGRDHLRLESLRAEIQNRFGRTIEILALDWGEIGADQTISRKFGKLAGIIHCAGSYGEIGKIAEVDLGRWINSVENQIIGAINAVKLATFWSHDQHLSVVLLSGGGASQAYAGLSAYSVAKTALVRLVETTALETPVSRISINALGPGATMSSMAEAALSNAEHVDERVLEVSRKLMAQDTPSQMNKFLSATSWLLSEKGRSITGKFLSAQWDNWQELVEGKVGTDDYTLRRVF